MADVTPIRKDQESLEEEGGRGGHQQSAGGTPPGEPPFTATTDIVVEMANIRGQMSTLQAHVDGTLKALNAKSDQLAAVASEIRATLSGQLPKIIVAVVTAIAMLGGIYLAIDRALDDMSVQDSQPQTVLDPPL